jgi:hypothetical protein
VHLVEEVLMPFHNFFHVKTMFDQGWGKIIYC